MCNVAYHLLTKDGEPDAVERFRSDLNAPFDAQRRLRSLLCDPDEEVSGGHATG